MCAGCDLVILTVQLAPRKKSRTTELVASLGVETVKASINTQPGRNGPAASVDHEQTRMALMVHSATTHW
jgi:hypothetical protein